MKVVSKNENSISLPDETAGTSVFSLYLYNILHNKQYHKTFLSMKTLEEEKVHFRHAIHCGFERIYPDGVNPDTNCEYSVREGDHCKITLILKERSEDVEIAVSDIKYGRSHTYTCTLKDFLKSDIEQNINRILDEYLYVLKEVFYADMAIQSE